MGGREGLGVKGKIMFDDTQDRPETGALQDGNVAALAALGPQGELLAQLRSVQAIAQMADIYGPRFLLWRGEPNEKGGLDKRPKRLDGRTDADVTDPRNGHTLERCCAAL